MISGSERALPKRPPFGEEGCCGIYPNHAMGNTIARNPDFASGGHRAGFSRVGKGHGLHIAVSSV